MLIVDSTVLECSVSNCKSIFVWPNFWENKILAIGSIISNIIVCLKVSKMNLNPKGCILNKEFNFWFKTFLLIQELNWVLKFKYLLMFRMSMFLTDSNNIKEVLFFPAMKPEDNKPKEDEKPKENGEAKSWTWLVQH